MACDVSDRDAVAGLIAGVPEQHPLTAVIHAAAVLDDGTITSLTPERVDTVMRPKADAAWYLHEATAGLDLDAFILFSSFSATSGGAGQGNYAAANAFLDALASHRQVQGLPAASLAWGWWADSNSMTGLGHTDHARFGRAGVRAMSAAEGLALFDLAIRRPEANLVPVGLDLPRHGGPGSVPSLLRGLVSAGGPARPVARVAVQDGTGLAGRLAALTTADQQRLLLDLVRGHVATVLGHASAEVVDPEKALRDMGFDSLTTVELRNRLATATGLRLPATLAFDHPTVSRLADYLRQRLTGTVEAVQVTPVSTTAVDEPIAIVGMGCRFPGGVESPEQLWALLTAGVDTISTFPTQRGWDVTGDGSARVGGFVEDVAGFDAAFFGISPREALVMDPQQRLLLETAWEALERAGIDPNTLKGSKTGVFVGGTGSGYDTVGDAVEEVDGYLLTGAASSVLSGRIAYTLGLEGPAVTVDTACSSSLVALHLAAQALRSGECSMALAGGVTVMATPGVFIAGSAMQGGVGGDGRCKAFAATADGFGVAEGVGLLVVERLSDAQRNGHQVLAVVRGSAINQDGASNGLTAPNGPSQQRVIRQALASAGVAPAEVDVVEAHGTGTRLGDPIEAQALLATYGQDRPEDRPLWLGSVKSNLGHTQAAAGVAGVIKMVLAMRHGQLPPTLHVDQPTPEVDWSVGAVELLTEQQPWPTVDRPWRAGVSSFGISGTNAHVILEQAPEPTPVTGADVTAPPVVPWVLSARSETALREQARRLAAHVEAAPELDPVDVGAALVSTRASFGHRAVVLGTDRDELIARLTALAEGEPAAGVVTGAAAQGGRTAFLFTGQAAHRAGMGRELAAAFPVFADAYDEVRAQFAEWPAGSSTDDELADPRWARAALFAFEVALFRLLSSWGVTPDYVAGHSTGEAVAAYVAGAWSLDDARKLLTTGDDESGTAVAETLSSGPSRIALVSLESGELVGERPVFAVADTERPARYAEAVDRLREQGVTRFVELGPDAALTALRPDGVDAEFVAVQRQDRPQVWEAMAALAFLHTRGVAVNWRAVFARSGAQRVSGTQRVELPTYAFQRERFWLAASGTGGVARAGLSTAGHALLGAVVRLADRDELVFTSRLSQATHPWLADHRIGAAAVLPVAALVDIAMRAGDEAGCAVVQELTVRTPLVIPDQGAVQVQIVVGSPDEEDRRSIAVYARGENTDDDWLAHATGLLSAAAGEPAWTERTWPPADARPVPVEDAYGMLAERGHRYGPVFQGLRAVWRRAGAVFAEVALPQQATGESTRFGVHPALLEAALHPLLIAAGGDVRTPLTWTDVSLHATGATALRVALTPVGDDAYRLDLADEVGNTVATAQVSQWECVSTDALAGERGAEDDLLRVQWVPVGPLEDIGERHDEDVVALLGDVSGGFPEAGFLRFADVTEAAGSYEPWDILVAESPAVSASDGELPSAVHRAVQHVLAVLQAWVTRDDLPDNRLVVFTRGAVAASEGEAVVDLAGAAVWGLVRAAQSEHPGRITLVDIPAGTGGPVPWARVAEAAASEPQVAVRDGELLVPQLVRTADSGPARPALAEGGTVLVTGGTGALGAMFARHLVTRHGVRHLVLAGRRGAGAPQADALRETLVGLGAHVEFVACDVADRESVARMLAGIGEEHPLTGVVHVAGALDDGVVTSLTGERVTEVLRPKADGAWHLHELTRHLELDLFVLFSSVSGVLGMPGQANYAAASAFLDGLAEHRRAQGMPAVSLAWGLFDDTAAAAKQLGLRAITAETATRLFDRALLDGPAAVVPAPLDLDRLAQGGVRVPALLRSLLPDLTIQSAGHAAGAEKPLAERLAELPRGEAVQYVRDLVRRETATALGYASAGEVAPEVSFRDAGFDSLAAVRFRNQLTDKTGLQLPTTLVFEYTSPADLADHLVSRLVVTEESPERAVLAELDRLEAALMSLPAGPSAGGHPESEAIAARLDAIVSRWQTTFSPSGGDGHAETVDTLQDASEEEVLAFLDRRFRRDER
nr:type I polyketide synthase [Streptomyces caeruleatus]